MSLISRELCRLGARLNDFQRSRRGNVSILLGLSLVPMVGLVGLGIDYGVAQSTKTKLDNAADAAAVAAVATAKAYVAANPTDNNVTANAIAAGKDRATRAFKVNAGSVPYASVPTPTIALVASNGGQTFSSSVSYTTTSLNHFGQIFGSNTMSLGGQAAASADVPSYLDFYLLVDVSGSMGLPSTSAGQTALMKKSTDHFPNDSEGCQFACHFPGNNGWTAAKSNNIELRSGAVNTAVCGLIAQASAPTVPNQYRVGLYPFIAQMATLSPLSTNFTTLKNAATCNSTPTTAFTALLDTGTTQLFTGNDPSTGTGSGGTHFETVFPQMKTTIQSSGKFGTGAAANNSRPFVFFITDGMDNPQHYNWYTNKGVSTYPGNPSTFSGYGNANFDGSTPQAIDPTLCKDLISAGATISILYIPYTTLIFDTDPYGENGKANKAIPSLPANLVSCASPGYFYTANTPADINTALNNMFLQAIRAAHLSK